MNRADAELVAKLRAYVTAFEDDVADELAREGERADLWTQEIDVPVSLLRDAASAIEARRAATEGAVHESPVGEAETPKEDTDGNTAFA